MNNNYPLRQCSNCLELKHFKKLSWCNECKVKQLRENRHRYKPEDRIKKRARWVAYYHQKKGYLIPQPCERCGSEETNKHHEDYSKPLNVKWLCGPCHYEIHIEERKRSSK